MNAKQEMLDLILDIDLDVEGRNVVGETVPHNTMRIRAILETHELVPVDTRPFDPTLCGATPVRSTIHRINGFQEWALPQLTLTKFEDGHGEFEQAFTGHKILIPWPETQSDGEALLRLLGVGLK